MGSASRHAPAYVAPVVHTGRLHGRARASPARHGARQLAQRVRPQARRTSGSQSTASARCHCGHQGLRIRGHVQRHVGPHNICTLAASGWPKRGALAIQRAGSNEAWQGVRAPAPHPGAKGFVDLARGPVKRSLTSAWPACHRATDPSRTRRWAHSPIHLQPVPCAAHLLGVQPGRFVRTMAASAAATGSRWWADVVLTGGTQMAAVY